jgi:hypothetical protein
MQTYLFGHDYGMGGVLVYVDAETPDDVVAMYPLLKHIPDRPDWLDDDLAKKLIRFKIGAEPPICRYFRGEESQQ